MLDLFADAEPWQEPLAPGATILRRFALSARRRCSTVLMPSPPVPRFAIWSRPAGIPCPWR